MGANDVQFQIIGTDRASGAFQSVSSAAAGTTSQITSLGRATSTVNQIFTSAAGYAAGIAGFNGITAAIQGTVGAVYNFQKSMEVHETGLAGILISMTEIDGRALSWGESIGISKQIMAQLNMEALRTAATTEELTTAFRGILGPALNAGMTLEQITQLTVTGVNAVKSIMPASADMQRQLVQELRDLVAGGIQASSSTLATALGLKDKDIKAAKESSEGLFKFLMDRLKGFEISAPYYAKTWQGLWEQIKEGITLAGSQGTSGLFGAIKAEMDGLSSQVVKFNQETNKMEVNPAIVDTFKSVSNTLMTAGHELKEFGNNVGVVVVPVAKVLGSTIKFAAEHAQLLATAGAGWYVLSKVSLMAAAGQKFLAQAVADTEKKYAEQAARAAQAAALERDAAITAAQAQIQQSVSVETASVAAVLGQKNLAAVIQQTVVARNEELAATTRTAEAIAAANAAAKLGQYEVAQAILATNLSISEQSALASVMAERMALAVTAAKAGQLELAQQILATNITLAEQGNTAIAAGQKTASAATASAVEQRALAGATSLTTAAQIESGVAAEAAGAKTVSAMAVAKTAAGNFLSSLWALAGGWLGVALATGLAIKALADYYDAKNKVDSYNQKAEVYEINGKLYKKQWVNNATTDTRGNALPGWGKVELSPEEYEEHHSWKTWRDELENKKPWNTDTSVEDLMKRLGAKYTSTDDDGKAARKAERAYEEQQRLMDKVADMVAKMNEKVSGVTATAYETSTQKLQDEAENMRRELDKSAIDFAKYGIDVSGVYEKITKYQETMTANIEKQRKQSLAGVITDTESVLAGVNGNLIALADAEYRKELAKIQKDRDNDEIFKKIAKGPSDTEARQVSNAFYTSQEDAALKARNDKYREAKLQQYELDLSYHNSLLALNKKTAAETDAADLEIYNNKIQFLQGELDKAYIVGQARINLENQLAATIQKKNEILSKNITTAWGVAQQEIANQQTNWAQLMVQSFNNIEESFVDNFAGVLQQTESFSEAYRNIFNSMVNDIERMMIRMWYRAAIMQPIQNWWGNIIGGMFGGGKTTAGTTSGGTNIQNVDLGAYASGGIASGWSIVGEKGPGLAYFSNPARIYTADQSQKMLSQNSAPSIQLNITNNTGSDITAQKTNVSFDGEKYVCNVVLDKVSSSPAYARNFRDALGVT